MIIKTSLFLTELDSQELTPGELHIRKFVNRGRSAPLRNAKYPSRPPAGLATMPRTLPNGPAPCDASTILVNKGPSTVGWNDGGVVKYFLIEGRVAVYDHKLKCLTILDPRYYTEMGASDNTPAPKHFPTRSSSSSSGSNFNSDSELPQQSWQ